MTSRELPKEEELYADYLINAPWFAAKELCDAINKIPIDRCIEVEKSIEDTIALLTLARIGFNNRKQ
jgi:hypothetical protein